MSLRGRGTLEIGPSKSPFYQTTYSTHGIDPYSPPQWDSRKVNNQEQQNQVARYNQKKNVNEIDTKMMSFLYSRESDRIGSKPDTLQSLKQQMETDTRNNQHQYSQDEMRQIEEEEEDEEDRIYYEETMMQSQQRPGIPSAQEFLQHYKHNPKEEHPLYITAGVSYELKLNKLIYLYTHKISFN